jgi:folate-dependent phosphoribosylglycinamide formyltransferase PurN
MCSQRAPGLVALLDRDPRRGRDYEIVCCITSSELFEDDFELELRGIPCVTHSIRAFCRHRGAALGDLGVRVSYDAATLELLSAFGPDVIVLDGYLLLLTAPLLQAYPNRIINIHHADLHLRAADGAPRYPGLRAVRDAIAAGEGETRACAHLVTPVLDDGPVLLRSWAFPVPPGAAWARRQGQQDVLKAYAWAHQEWMLRSAWEPIMARVIELAGRAPHVNGRIDLRTAGEWEATEGGTLLPALSASQSALAG